MAHMNIAERYVPQDGLLFEGTVLDNLRLNSPDADMEAVIAAARVAAARRPQGLKGAKPNTRSLPSPASTRSTSRSTA